MNEEILNIKNEIYSFPKSFDFFKSNDFASASYKLTCDIEEIFLGLLSTEVVFSNYDKIGICQDKFRGGYRTALKWAYDYCVDTDNRFQPLLCKYEFASCNHIISEAQRFNNIRNCFERVDLGKLKVKLIDGKHIKFDLPASSRSINADLYARWIDHESYGDIEKKKTLKYDEKTFVHMIAPEYKGVWNDFSKTPIDTQLFSRVYRDCLNKIKFDTEDYSNINFGLFTLDDFEKVYATLMALGIMNFNYQRKLREKSPSLKGNIPIVFSEISLLIQFIYDNSKVKRKAAKCILELLSYNPEFHKDKITIVQPLFSFGKFIFYSPSLLYYSDAVDKLLYLIKEQNNMPEVISKIAKEREQVMTERLVHYISEKSNLKCVSNYKLTNNGLPIAEFDILIYDNNTNSLLLTELKHFFKADGEAGHQKVDFKIRDSIKSRLSKQLLAEKHIDTLFGEAFEISNLSTLPKIKSCIVSQNYSGSSFLDDKIAIFDEFLFKHTLSRYNYRLGDLFDSIDSDSYIPDMSKNISYHDYTEGYAGYKITYPGLVQKT